MTGHDQRLGDPRIAAALRAFRAQGDPYAVRHTVQLTSFGGSGTTALTDSFQAAGLDLPPGPGQWPHKHTRRPPHGDAVPSDFRVVYPVGDPRDAVLSVFRRGYQWGHWRALHDVDEQTETPAFLDSLDAFLARDQDEFALEAHFDAWLAHPAGYPVMVVRFDRIDEVWDELRRFVGLPADHPRVTYRPRHSDWSSTEPGVRARLDELYGSLAARIDELPATMVV